MKVRELFEGFNTLKTGLTLYSIDLKNEYPDKDYSDIKLVNFTCHSTWLYVLKNCPINVDGNYEINYTSVRELSDRPKHVGGYFDCSDTKISSLKGVGTEYLEFIGKECMLSKNISSHILGLLKVKGLKEVETSNLKLGTDLRQAVEIINKHLGFRNINKCKSELKDVGLEEYAQL